MGFEGFSITSENGKLTWYKTMVEGIKVRMENYTLKDNFHVFPLGGIHTIVL